GQRATKSNLRVELYDRINRVPLTRLEDGGTKQAKSGMIANPTKAIRRGSNGAAPSTASSTLATGCSSRP
ncbi:hypothetical protein MKK75_31400, partial [Methylobacterium sp. J-030]|uniref:hypothetical protein n=1 Tax=Methylobacterium sp. J-030 TaxID=2836627 RepID=UPI001FBBE8E7